MVTNGGLLVLLVWQRRQNPWDAVDFFPPIRFHVPGPVLAVKMGEEREERDSH